MVPERALDNPYWHALTGPQSAIALGDGKARRYRPRYGPQAALAEPSEQAYADLQRLVPPGEKVAVLWSGPSSPPAGWTRVFELELEQRVCRRAAPAPAIDAVVLGDADLPEVLALAEAAQPGPVAEGALELGRFVGVRERGRLVAMAGVRAHLHGYREISAVCTVPEWRGRGLAKGLVAHLVRGLLADGEVPFLHVRTDNPPAIRAYERLGFVRRRALRVAVWRRQEA